MKLMTLNTHSLVEENYEDKQRIFVDAIIKEKPDIIALQEVSQSISGKEDNHAKAVADLLNKAGLNYYWKWTPIKKGYEIYEEGIAIFSKSPILEVKEFYVSESRDYNNWKTRKVIGIKNEEYKNTWFFSVHFGWWEDEEEPFFKQWNLMEFNIKEIVSEDRCYVMGDFNSPYHIRNQGFDYVKKTGWWDTWELADKKDEGNTVEKNIDGWRGDIFDKEVVSGMRLDYIWCNQMVQVKSSQVIFNGKKYDAVSDHYGVMVEIDNI